MAASTRVLRRVSISGTIIPRRYTNMIQPWILERQRAIKLNKSRVLDDDVPAEVTESTREYKHIYPEFLPDAMWYRRDPVRERLERRDMSRRRLNIDIPEYYVGSVLAVTVSDQYAPGKLNKFVGICIDRGGHGLRHYFVLRNVIEGEGVEISYDMYNPTIRSIDVLKLEKRLDEQLYYLRDAPREYSTVPFDMDPVPHPKGVSVPVNDIKIPLNPRPWHVRWERAGLHGVQDLGLKQRFYDRAEALSEPWEKYDIMKQYRKAIHEEDQAVVFGDIERMKKNIEKKKS